MLDAKKIVEWALSQVGYEEPHHDNHQKYGAMLDQLPWYLYKDGDKIWIHKVDGFNWCTQFVDSGFISVYTIDYARKTLYRPQYNNYGAVVKYAFNYFKSAGQGFTKAQYDPKPGDVIYFQNSEGLSHTGIVVDVTSSQVTTVEGNSGKNSWFVAKNTYKKTSSYIYGYGHPDYANVGPEPAPTPTPSEYPDTPFEITVLKDKVSGLRTGGWASCDYMGELKAGKYTVKKVNNDFGMIEAWVYLKTDNLVINGQTIDGYTVGEKYRVICSEPLNVRTMASTKGIVVTSLKQGTEIVCKSITHDEEGNTWLRIDAPASGWVCAIYHGEKYIG